MNVKKEIRIFQEMNANRQLAVWGFLAALLFWWAVLAFAPSSSYKILCIIPLGIALLNIVRVAPKQKTENQKEGQK